MSRLATRPNASFTMFLVDIKHTLWRVAGSPANPVSAFRRRSVAAQLTQTLLHLSNVKKIQITDAQFEQSSYRGRKISLHRAAAQCVFTSVILCHFGPVLVHLVLQGTVSLDNLPPSVRFPALESFTGDFVSCEKLLLRTAQLLLTSFRLKRISLSGLPNHTDSLPFPTKPDLFPHLTTLEVDGKVLRNTAPLDSFLSCYRQQIQRLVLGRLYPTTVRSLNPSTLRFLHIEDVGEEAFSALMEVLHPDTGPGAECALEDLEISLVYPSYLQHELSCYLPSLRRLSLEVSDLNIDCFRKLLEGMPNLGCLRLITTLPIRIHVPNSPISLLALRPREVRVLFICFASKV